jgi:3-deoxy-manno-octulosonate cytidylyltransferase (CMP-KDO synthetase)
MRIFIPSRYESTRFPGKSLALIKGKPMVQHVFERSIKLADSYVVTDDKRVFDCVESFGKGKVILSKKKHVCGTDRIAEAVSFLIPAIGTSDEIIVNVQGDQPFFDDSCVIGSVEALMKSKYCGSIYFKMKNHFDTNVVRVVTNDRGNALYFSRLPIPFGSEFCMKHLGFYAFTIESLKWFAHVGKCVLEMKESLEQLRILYNGGSIQMKEVFKDAPAVNVSEDIKKVEALLG